MVLSLIFATVLAIAAQGADGDFVELGDPPMQFYDTQADALANEGPPPQRCLARDGHNECIATFLAPRFEDDKGRDHIAWVAGGWRKADQIICADATASFQVACTEPNVIPVPRFRKAIVCPIPPGSSERVCGLQEITLPTREEFEAEAKAQTEEP